MRKYQLEREGPKHISLAKLQENPCLNQPVYQEKVAKRLSPNSKFERWGLYNTNTSWNYKAWQNDNLENKIKYLIGL